MIMKITLGGIWVKRLFFKNRLATSFLHLDANLREVSNKMSNINGLQLFPTFLSSIFNITVGVCTLNTTK